MSIFLGFSLFLFWLTSSPAAEKSLSEGTDVAGMQRNFLSQISKLSILAKSISIRYDISKNIDISIFRYDMPITSVLVTVMVYSGGMTSPPW